MAPTTNDQPSAATPNRRRWNAFVCQDCRAVFRIPSDYTGKGVVCPQCDRMLRIPRAGESIPALVQPTAEQGQIKREIMGEMNQMEHMETARTEPQPAAATSPSPTAPSEQAFAPTSDSDPKLRRRKKRKERTHDAESEWVKNPARRVRFSRNSSYRSWWIASTVLVVILGSVMFMILQDRKKSATAQAALSSTTANPAPLPAVPIASPAKAIDPKKRQAAKIKSALLSAKKFLAAQNVSELLEHIRDAKTLQSRVTDYYEKHPLTSPSPYQIDPTTAVLLANGSAFQVIANSDNLPPRAIVLIAENGNFLVDWESWVGWSEMDFEEIKQKKPLTPVEVRVIVTEESYYNFDFPTEKEKDWQSYRLEFSENRYLYGYVRRDHPVVQELRPVASESNGTMILKIRYIEAGSHSSQVVIDSVVSESWVKNLPQ